MDRQPRHDENLPEVVPDSSPQTLTHGEEFQRSLQHDGTPKYSVVDTQGSPKEVTGGGYGTPTTAGWSPATAPPPWSAQKEVVGDHAGTEPVQPAEKRICGLKRKTLLILVAILLVTIVVAVGGGVGGAEAARKKKAAAQAEADAAAAPSTSQSSTATSTSPTSTSSTTSSASATPTNLNNSTGPDRDFEFQGFAEKNYAGERTPVVKKTGFLDLPFRCNSYVWLPNNTGCCVTFCANATEAGNVGWRCGEFHQQSASSEFGRLYIGCGADASQENSRCVPVEEE